jgi:hypothetical protein
MMKRKTIDDLAQDVLSSHVTQPHPMNYLMSRLASGSKADIKKSDMFKLTNKNYENLPEVKRKKEEEKKKEDRKRQVQLAKEMEKQRR